MSPLSLSNCRSALRSLTRIPTILLPALIGLADLLIGHEAWHDHRDVVIGILRSATQYEAHYYIAMSIVASRHELVGDLVDLARAERDTTKLRNYIDALSVRAFDAELTQAVAELKRKL